MRLASLSGIALLSLLAMPAYQLAQGQSNAEQTARSEQADGQRYSIHTTGVT